MSTPFVEESDGVEVSVNQVNFSFVEEYELGYSLTVEDGPCIKFWVDMLISGTPHSGVFVTTISFVS